ncbi:metal-sulfur cluster biosynthetic enzyme [Paucibacter oligotrophus]|uniref:Metal-sulfur cluster biosynthetic enzyme n=1 Tax=Roseateles oligotrophus TaxID=1769250 RepID=A0A840LDT3_9BURK|nr:iron-sulfur cluster assembly protein [Roseateles oligotrophus]MBB4844229.1 metal-sulfur cluster biosynthetic enzyme [Roseateles oligotrophus]
MNESDMAALRQRIMDALAQVMDPEIGESIVALGLLESLSLSPGLAELLLIPTSATCPMADQLMEEAGRAIEAQCPPDWRVEVDMDWGLPWSPARMTPALRARLGWSEAP